MSCVDLHNQFLSYCKGGAQHSSSNWQQSQLLKSSNNALADIQELQSKISYLTDLEKKKRSKLQINKQQLSQKLGNVHSSIKLCENQIKKISKLQIDFKTSDRHFGEEVKNSIMAGLQLKIMSIGIRFKKLYKSLMENQSKKTIDQQDTHLRTNAKDLGKSHFLEQTEEQIMEEAAVHEYKEIEKSIGQISEMYKQTMSVVKMHQLLIDSISGNIDETEMNVDSGRKHLTEAHHRQSKNRSFIIKIFAVLYTTVTIYIVFLS